MVVGDNVADIFCFSFLTGVAWGSRVPESRVTIVVVLETDGFFSWGGGGGRKWCCICGLTNLENPEKAALLTGVVNGLTGVPCSRTSVLLVKWRCGFFLLIMSVELVGVGMLK